jgi:hypothetical protein
VADIYLAMSGLPPTFAGYGNSVKVGAVLVSYFNFLKVAERLLCLCIGLVVGEPTKVIYLIGKVIVTGSNHILKVKEQE